MEIYFDLEDTLLNSNKMISKEGYHSLSYLSKHHKVYVLTNGILAEAKQLTSIPNLTIISTIENKMIKNHSYQYTPLHCDKINDIIKFPFLYTLYAIDEDTTYILKYQERLKFFYPNRKLKICTSFPSTIASFIIAIYKEGFDLLKAILKEYHIETLAEDSKKAMLLVTKTESTKENWLLRLKESPAIAIGDSPLDYSFIKHCEVQVAMKNGDPSLQALCPYQTQKTNQENGALDFVISYLEHLQA